MSDNSTKHMIEAYNEGSTPTLHFSGMYQSPKKNFYNSETIEYDIRRGGRQIAVAVSNIAVGYNINENAIFTNKELIAPVLKEAIMLNSFKLIKRQFGENSFQDPNYRKNLILEVMLGSRNNEDKIRRTIELQAAQILQNGVVDLTNSDGKTVYSIDFKPKGTHFFTAGTAWDQVGALPMADIDKLAALVLKDHLTKADEIHMGSAAFGAFITNASIKEHFDNRRIDQGSVAAKITNGEGGQYRGVLQTAIGRYDIWTYDGLYQDPDTGTDTPYLTPSSCIVRASGGRMDATFGNIPIIGDYVGMTKPSLPGLPGRMSNVRGGLDMMPNVWLSEDRTTLFAGVSSRPLLIPTAIDSFGNINTGV